VTVKGDMWDQAGQPLKTLRYGDIQQVDPAQGKWQAMTSEARNGQTGHTTVVRIANFKLDRGIGGEVFTTRYLEQER
jgi:hypothetical protein